MRDDFEISTPELDLAVDGHKPSPSRAVGMLGRAAGN
jgi:hypothetical protein